MKTGSRMLVLALLVLCLNSMCGASAPGRSLTQLQPQCKPGNNRGNNAPPELGPTGIKCTTDQVTCHTGECSGSTCVAVCSDGKSITLTVTAGVVSVPAGYTVNKLVVKGGPYYCVYTSTNSGQLPKACGQNNYCGLSHADFCYTPAPPSCVCTKAKLEALTFPPNTKTKFCPGETIPTLTATTKVCGEYVVAKPYPEKAPWACGPFTVTYTAKCPKDPTIKITFTRQFTVEDTDVVLDITKCPVTAKSYCGAATVYTSTAYNPQYCKVTVTFKAKNKCGVYKSAQKYCSLSFP